MSQATIEERIAAAFGLDEDTWMRHANPWSVWTRYSVLPLLIVAAWSRAWIGAWWLVPLGLALAWAWINPRLFPPPARLDSWASQAVLGERVWMNRRAVSVPAHHRWAPLILSGVAAVGALFVMVGLWALHGWTTALGTVLVYAGKLWFLDRMAWLYRDMAKLHAPYAAWMR